RRDWAHSRRLGTPADEAGSVVLRQPPASKLANLFRIDVRVWWVAPPWPILPVPAVLLALCLSCRRSEQALERFTNELRIAPRDVGFY
ncbi:MAG: hypothetical protein ABSE84_12005, partial [Isosphaeraceae bacterium]